MNSSRYADPSTVITCVSLFLLEVSGCNNLIGSQQADREGHTDDYTERDFYAADDRAEIRDAVGTLREHESSPEDTWHFATGCGPEFSVDGAYTPSGNVPDRYKEDGMRVVISGHFLPVPDNARVGRLPINVTGIQPVD